MLLIPALLALTLGLASTCLASEQIAIVQGNFVNLRYGPSTGYHIAVRAPKGTILKVVGQRSVWYKVNTPSQLSSKSLWASRNKALEIIETDATTQANAYLRSGPGFTFPVVSKLPKGTSLKIVGKFGLWYKVTTTDLNLKVAPFWVTAKMGIVKLDKEPAQPVPAPATTAASAPIPAPSPVPASTSAPAVAPVAKPQPATSSTAVADQRWLVRNSAGRYLILDDTSYWKVAPSDMGTSSAWSSGDNINVLKSNDASYTVILFNTSRGNSVKVQLIAR